MRAPKLHQPLYLHSSGTAHSLQLPLFCSSLTPFIICHAHTKTCSHRKRKGLEHTSLAEFVTARGTHPALLMFLRMDSGLFRSDRAPPTTNFALYINMHIKSPTS